MVAISGIWVAYSTCVCSLMTWGYSHFSLFPSSLYWPTYCWRYSCRRNLQISLGHDSRGIGLNLSWWMEVVLLKRKIADPTSFLWFSYSCYVIISNISRTVRTISQIKAIFGKAYEVIIRYFTFCERWKTHDVRMRLRRHMRRLWRDRSPSRVWHGTK